MECCNKRPSGTSAIPGMGMACYFKKKRKKEDMEIGWATGLSLTDLLPIKAVVRLYHQK